jgi:hypothetical protein
MHQSVPFPRWLVSAFAAALLAITAVPSAAENPPSQTAEHAPRNPADNSGPNKDKSTAKAKPAWQQCPSGRAFRCEPVQQGVAASPDRPPPLVCGCPPKCSRFQVPHATLSDKKWPDGSNRANYSCIAFNSPPPPSAAANR